MNLFHVHVTLPEVLSCEFRAVIPEQQQRIYELMEQKVLLNYAMDMERNSVWLTTISTINEKSVRDILNSFPGVQEVKNIEISELAFFESAPSGFPELMLN